MAQQILGNITGSVSDSSGAVVSQVEVKLVSKGTNFQLTTKSSDNGDFSFTNLPIGTYTVTFAKDGFKTEQFTEIVVQADRTTTLKATVQAGGASETITVTASSLLNETDVSNGYILNSTTIQGLPLGTGSFTQLAVLTPGVNADLLAGSDSNAGLGNQNIYANGQRDTSNTFSVNGITANNLFNGKSSSQVAENRNTLNTGTSTQANFSPNGVTRTNTSVFDAIGQGLPTLPVEALQEIRVNASMFDATQGGTSGAQIAQIAKSGSNDYHGQLYEYLQNDAFNAAPFFFNANPAVTTKVPPLRRNTFGVTMGGPIIKDKLFFFASYQGLRDSDALSGSSNISVPSLLTDDRSAATLATEFGIPAASINPASLTLLNFKLPNGGFLIPTPTINTTSAATLGFNAFQQAPATFLADLFNANIDYNVSDKDRLAGKYFFQRDPTTSPFGVSKLAGFTQQLTSGSQVFSLDNTRTISPNMTWELKGGFIREKVFSNNVQPLAPADAGINIHGGTLFPEISISNIAIAPTRLTQSVNFGANSSISPDAGVFQNQGSISSNLNWVKGRHTFAFGADFSRNQLNIINHDDQLAILNFNSFTDFLTGTLSSRTNSTTFSGVSSRYYRSNQIGAFANDNFKLRPNLTITMGLRYDYDGPLVEKNGNLLNFDPSAFKYDLASDTILNTGLVIAGNNPHFATPGASSSTLNGRQWGVGPRLGVAWSPSFIKNFVVRAGYGIYYDRGEYFSEFSPGAGAGNGGPFGVTRELPFVAQTAVRGTSLSNPFPTLNPTGDPALFTLPNRAAIIKGAQPFSFGGYDSQNTLPYTQNWSLDFQWQPVNSLVFTLGYTGNHGTHEVLPIPFNLAGIATPQHPINGETSSYSVNIKGATDTPLSTFDLFSGGNVALRVPFLGYSSNSVLFESVGTSNYDALLFNVTKRLSKGLQLTGSYTWSHSLDESSAVGLFLKTNNSASPRAAYASSDYDRTHVLTVGYIYDFPKVTESNALLGRIANDWSISGIAVAESGTPFSVIDFSGGVGGLFGGLDVVDPILPLAPGQTVQNATLQGTHNVNPAKPGLNVNAFAAPLIMPGTNGVPLDDTVETGFGASGRNLFRAPFQTRFDFSVSKKIIMTERFKLQFRADFFNLFNTTSFDAPNNSVSLDNLSNPVLPGQTLAAPSSTTLGLIQRTIGSPRFMQFSLHLTF